MKKVFVEKGAKNVWTFVLLTFDATAKRKKSITERKKGVQQNRIVLWMQRQRKHTVKCKLYWREFVRSFVQRINVQRQCHSKHVLCVWKQESIQKLRRRWLLNTFTSWQSNWNENRERKKTSAWHSHSFIHKAGAQHERKQHGNKSLSFGHCVCS